MADPVQTAPPGKAPSPPVAPAVGKQPPAPPAVVPSPSAKVTAAKHGGLRGGRKRADGLIPGSPEAIKADQDKDAERKRLEREAQKKADPAPIPAAGGPGQAPAGAVAGVPGVEGAPAVPWEPELLAPLVKQLVPTLEGLMTKQITGLCHQANLPNELVRDVEKDAAWNPVAKQAIELSAPRVAAKYLNKTGVSAEHQDLMVMGSACLSIAMGHFMVVHRLKELVAKANPPAVEPAKPVEDKKP